LVLGLLGGGIVSLFALPKIVEEGQIGWLWFFGGVAVIWESFVVYVLFRAAAEIIRLLKKSNGLA